MNITLTVISNPQNKLSVGALFFPEKTRLIYMYVSPCEGLGSTGQGSKTTLTPGDSHFNVTFGGRLEFEAPFRDCVYFTLTIIYVSPNFVSPNR